MVGRKIQELRKQRGITLSDLADRAKISKSYLSNIERNLNQNPSIQIINKLAIVLDVDLRELITDETQIETSDQLETEWINFINELKDSGIDKEQIHEYKTLIEFIKWKNEQVGAKQS